LKETPHPFHFPGAHGAQAEGRERV
jgi:hypothetical protein